MRKANAEFSTGTKSSNSFDRPPSDVEDIVRDEKPSIRMKFYTGLKVGEERLADPIFVSQSENVGSARTGESLRVARQIVVVCGDRAMLTN
jgi:hypothetical protein